MSEAPDKMPDSLTAWVSPRQEEPRRFWTCGIVNAPDQRKYLLSTPPREHADELVEALEDAGRKLSSYVGVCKGDKELTEAILPKIRSLLAKIEQENTNE